MSTHTYTADAGATENQVLVEQTQAATEPTQLEPGTLAHVVVPAGARAELIDLERLQAHPRLAAGTAIFDDIQSLIPWTTRHDVDEETTIWVSFDKRSVTVVLNDDATGAGGDPGWRDWRGQLQLQHTPEWDAWAELDQKLVSQEQFALHIEQQIPTISDPDGATLLEIAETFHATTGVNYRSRVNVTSGEVGFAYEEQQEATAGRSGELRIPRDMVLVMPCFVGQENETIKAKLRWRIGREDKQLRLGYVLERPDLVVRAALDKLHNELSEAFGGDRVFRGTPPPAR